MRVSLGHEVSSQNYNRGKSNMGGQRRPLPFQLRLRTNEEAAIRRSGLGEEHSRQRAQRSIKAQGKNKLAKFEEQKEGHCDYNDSGR